MKESSLALVKKTMSQRNLDVAYCLATCLNLPAPQALSYIKKHAASYGSQYLRTIALSNVAITLCHIKNLSRYASECSTVKKDAIWGYIVSKYKVSIY